MVDLPCWLATRSGLALVGASGSRHSVCRCRVRRRDRDLAYRLTVTVRVADAVHHNVPPPDWYTDVTGWADDGLLGAAGLLVGVAVLLFG
jgi:hypothetical protein